MDYAVLLKKSAEKELERLPARAHDPVVQRLLGLRHQPRPIGSKKLYGQEAYRIRVGEYRILYVVNDSRRQVEIFSVTHRREAYR